MLLFCFQNIKLHASYLCIEAQMGNGRSNPVQPGGRQCEEEADSMAGGWQRCCAVNDTGKVAYLVKPRLFGEPVWETADASHKVTSFGGNCEEFQTK